MTRNRFGAALITAVLLTPLLTVTSVSARAGDLFPDLEMAPLYQLALGTSGGHKVIRFGTIVYNVGDGPMHMKAKRRVGDQLTKVFQVITNQDGKKRRIRKYKANVFYSGDGHDHFHIKGFNMVRLTPAPGNTYQMTERRLKKIGFCLVDSIRKSPAPPNSAPNVSFYWCGYSGSKTVKTGISVGWGDIYAPSTTFQEIDVGGLPVGDYRLCAIVNPSGVWSEKGKNYTNNSKWTDVRLDLENADPQKRLEVRASGEGC